MEKADIVQVGAVELRPVAKGALAVLRVCIVGMGPMDNIRARHYPLRPLCALAGACNLIKERAGEFAAIEFVERNNVVRVA